jgi:hypothetical protein
VAATPTELKAGVSGQPLRIAVRIEKTECLLHSNKINFFHLSGFPAPASCWSAVMAAEQQGGIIRRVFLVGDWRETHTSQGYGEVVISLTKAIHMLWSFPLKVRFVFHSLDYGV